MAALPRERIGSDHATRWLSLHPLRSQSLVSCVVFGMTSGDLPPLGWRHRNGESFGALGGGVTPPGSGRPSGRLPSSCGPSSRDVFLDNFARRLQDSRGRRDVRVRCDACTPMWSAGRPEHQPMSGVALLGDAPSSKRRVRANAPVACASCLARSPLLPASAVNDMPPHAVSSCLACRWSLRRRWRAGDACVACLCGFGRVAMSVRLRVGWGS